jgi:Protein of unknown function (DUF4242)
MWIARILFHPWRCRSRRREIESLDPQALRDLGLDRSELGSYDAESAGRAPRTRRRVSSHAGSHVQCLPSRFPINPTEIVMPKFVIERAIPGVGGWKASELQAASRKSCSVLHELGPQVQWVQSYVTDDKLYCVYNAVDEQLVREHARRAGFPADSVARVTTTIDPNTAEA